MPEVSALSDGPASPGRQIERQIISIQNSNDALTPAPTNKQVLVARPDRLLRKGNHIPAQSSVDESLQLLYVWSLDFVKFSLKYRH
jgi:hypothetical protein